MDFELNRLGHEVHIMHEDISRQDSMMNPGLIMHNVSHTLFWLLGGFKCMLGQPLLVYHAIDCMRSEHERKRIYSQKRKTSLLKMIKSTIYYNLLISADKTACRYADLIVTSCKDTACALSGYYNVPLPKIRVGYLGVSDNFANGFEITKPSTPTFLHVATDPERKGTIIFLEALKILREKYNLRAKAIIVGHRDSFYISTARTLGVDVVFTEKVLQKNKSLYASCTCLVSPSVSEVFVCQL